MEVNYLELEMKAFIFFQFIRSFLHLFTYSSSHLFICSFVHLFIGSFVYLFICSLVHLFICSLVYWFIGSLVHGFIGSLVHWFIGLTFVNPIPAGGGSIWPSPLPCSFFYITQKVLVWGCSNFLTFLTYPKPSL